MRGTVPGVGDTATNKPDEALLSRNLTNNLSRGEDIKHIITKILNYQKAKSWSHKTMYGGI